MPYFLRLFFFLKIIVYSVNFVQNKQYYIEYDEIILRDDANDQFSLYNYVVEWIRQHQQRANRSFMTESSTDQLDETRQRFVFDSFLSQFLDIFFSLTSPGDSPSNSELAPFQLALVYGRFLILNLSSTLIAIACTTSILSYQFYLLGMLVNKVTGQTSLANVNNANNAANARRNDLGGMAHIPEGDLSNVGDVAAVLFFLLSVQSGITYLTGMQRIEKLLKNYSLLFIAILHYFHTSIDTHLMSLSASSKPNWRAKRHLRVLALSVLLVIIPVIILAILWTYFEVFNPNSKLHSKNKDMLTYVIHIID